MQIHRLKLDKEDMTNEIEDWKAKVTGQRIFLSTIQSPYMQSKNLVQMLQQYEEAHRSLENTVQRLRQHNPGDKSGGAASAHLLNQVCRRVQESKNDTPFQIEQLRSSKDESDRRRVDAEMR